VANYFRGEVWMVNLNPTKGHEQSGMRPCLIVSADGLNRSRAELAIVIPITSKAKKVPSHVEVNPPEGGLTKQSFIQCEAIRAISAERLERVLGTVTIPTLDEVGNRLRLLLNL
jgi:mRNA interferase MazF